MMKRTGLWLLWISLGLTLHASAVRPQSHTTTVRAKRIITFRDRPYFDYRRFFFWQSSRRLLYYQATEQVSDGIRTSLNLEGWKLLDVINGKSIQCEALTRQHDYSDPDVHPASALLSPDGKWLLSWGFAAEADPAMEFSNLSMVDGTHHRSLHPVTFADFCWLDDSRHWVEWDSATARNRYHRVRIHRVENDAVEEIRVPWRGGLNGDVDIKDGRFVSPERLLLLLPIEYLGVDHVGFIRIAEWNLRHPISATRHYKILVGKGAEIGAVRFSSGGKRVACLFSPKNHRPWRIRVSNLDGTKGHDVAGLPWVSGRDVFGISDLDWSPDGKRLSFFYDHSVWVVPAD